MNITKHIIQVGMGRSDDWDTLGVNQDTIRILNRICHGSEKRYGNGSEAFETFLNSLDTHIQFEFEQTKYAVGDYHESYSVTRIEMPPVTELCPHMEEHIAKLKRKADILERKAKEFDDEELQKLSHGIVELAEALKQDIKS